jgi:Uma2 family endonuclease
MRRAPSPMARCASLPLFRAVACGHQAIGMHLASRIYASLADGPYEVLAAPVEIFLPADPDQPEDEVDTVVQPDIVVICDRASVRTRGIWGAPDWVIEILSPYTSRKDMKEKLELYQESGVKEYWIVDPGKGRSTKVIKWVKNPWPAGGGSVHGQPGERGTSESSRPDRRGSLADGDRRQGGG